MVRDMVRAKEKLGVRVRLRGKMRLGVRRGLG